MRRIKKKPPKPRNYLINPGRVSGKLKKLLRNYKRKSKPRIKLLKP
jgi:RNase P/RNase MRP subunit POP5